ncbi:MAG: hypothetical protein EA385_03670 [Salinarimonadaceae bacterium]|nr:MAG: hypothetical protein EA385_03670 [Salinarimonadaceae bacterium]
MKKIRSKDPGAPSSRAVPTRVETGGGVRETFRAFIRALEKIDGGSADKGRAPSRSGECAR